MTETEAEAKMLRFLAFRPRSIKEIRDFGKKRNIALSLVDQFIGKMKELEYLDDEKFTRMWVRDRKKLALLGRNRLQRELQAKGITRESAEKILDQEYPLAEEKKYARALLEKKKGRLTGPKIWAMLIRRGFNSGTVRSLVASGDTPVSSAIEGEGQWQ
jgi:regulatory protein